VYGHVRIADYGQLAVQNQGYDRRDLAQALAEGGQKREHEAEKRDRGNGHEDIRGVNNPLGQILVLGDYDPQGHPDAGGDQNGKTHNPDMLPGQIK
jgi:hypothetical protein